ncbi:MAG: gliding motility-associated ABC transporter ATP-binding subunit GldA [Ferruginibacter sp.]|nr:gliding motility-associated ABC transporter ATP-binding subunit GldA [Cytophagales bacterium]
MSVVVTHLTKQYGPQKAVDDVSFEVQPGQVVGFLGPNGAGKSTTMKIATGYLPPTSGSVEVNGFDVVKAPMAVRRSVGYLAEHNPLYLDMYVREFLAFVGSLHGLKGNVLDKRVRAMIEEVGLTPEQRKKIGALSKGYRQRVGLAQALIHDPPVLILDEPTTGLDPNQIVEIRRVIKDAGKEKTVVFSTHILQEVEALCDRVVIINLGQVVADSEVAALRNLRQNQQTVIAEFSSEVDPNLLLRVAGVSEVKYLSMGRYEIVADNQRDVRPDVFQLAAEQGLVLIGLRQQENNLERIFQTLTKQAVSQ